MPNTGASVHNVVYDARLQRFEGAVAIGDAPDFNVSIPGHQSWPYRKIAKEMISASQQHRKLLKGVRHDHP